MIIWFGTCFTGCWKLVNSHWLRIDSIQMNGCRCRYEIERVGRHETRNILNSLYWHINYRRAFYSEQLISHSIHKEWTKVRSLIVIVSFCHVHRSQSDTRIKLFDCWLCLVYMQKPFFKAHTISFISIPVYCILSQFNLERKLTFDDRFNRQHDKTMAYTTTYTLARHAHVQ